MKKIFLAVTGVALCFTLVACGTSQTDATINNLSNQLDKTANTISNLNAGEIRSLNMSKDDLDSLATKNKSICDNVLHTQQNLANEEYYKNDIINKTSQLKNCLSKNIKLSKAQTSAVKDLINNLGKYTNSVSYTKSELDSAMRSINSLKKNTTKNSEKINAKLNRIACNSNSRSVYYQNILSTLNELENYICCEDCEKQEHIEDNTQYSTTQTSEESNEDNTQKDGRYGLPYNIDTYGPTNRRNIDTFWYNNYNNRMYNQNLGYGNGFNRPFGYQNQMYPTPVYNGYYGNFNSNNFNRMNGYSLPVAEMNSDNEEYIQQTPENNAKLKNIEADTNVAESIKDAPRIEDYEEVKDGELTKVISKNDTTEASTKPIEIIEDNRTPDEIEKDLNQPTKAH